MNWMKGPMGAMMSVIGGVVSIIIFYTLMGAVETGSWNPGVAAMVNTIVPLALAVGTIFIAFTAIKAD